MNAVKLFLDFRDVFQVGAELILLSGEVLLLADKIFPDLTKLIINDGEDIFAPNSWSCRTSCTRFASRTGFASRATACTLRHRSTLTWQHRCCPSNGDTLMG
jgi:hypothetical protein